MKKFKVTVKHDNGKAILYYYGKDEQDARNVVMRQEGCPECAILKMELCPYYVTMTDKFMSGWGMAQGKTNKLIVVCDTWQDAETIQRNAEKRSEMKYINVTDRKPRYGQNVLESWKTFDELGEIWKKQ